MYFKIREGRGGFLSSIGHFEGNHQKKECKYISFRKGKYLENIFLKIKYVFKMHFIYFQYFSYSESFNIYSNINVRNEEYFLFNLIYKSSFMNYSFDQKNIYFKIYISM